MDDYDAMEDEAFPPLPPPQSPGQGGEDDHEPFDNGDVSKLADVPAAKRRVKRPQPKLDSNRLTSERGLPALRTLFENVRYKGKGHEAEDLRLLMQKMENWAHRLYPKLQFEDFVDKVEKLGSKKEVQTCLKRIRLDMPLTHEDFIGKEGEEEEEAAALQSHVFGSAADPPDDLQGPLHSTPAPPAPSLTEEQRRRMELNRQRALEKRLARQQQPTDPSESQADASVATDGPSTNILTSDQSEEVEGLDLEPISSSTQRPKDAELSEARSIEGETSESDAIDHTDRCEDGP